MRKLFLPLAIGGLVVAGFVLFLLRPSSTLDATHVTPCADLNGDGAVTLADIYIEVTYFLQSVPPAPAQVDMNGDTTVDLVYDIFGVVFEFGTLTNCQDKAVGPKAVPQPTPTPGPTPTPQEMSLSVKGREAVCDDPQKPTKCNVVPESQFTLSVEVNDFPVKGYWGVQTQAVYKPLKYKPSATAAEELVWPDGTGMGLIRVPYSPTGQEGVVAHAAVTGFYLPISTSTYVGNIVGIDLNCAASGSFKLALPVLTATNPFGAVFIDVFGNNVPPKIVGQQSVDVDGDTTPELVPVAATLEINCTSLPKQPSPADTDGDTCTDEQENGPDELLGGRRNYLNPWDFYDIVDGSGNPPGDGIVDLYNDIFALADHFDERPGDPGYSQALDRSPPPSAAEEPDSSKREKWDLGPPDGIIDLFYDIYAMADQFDHSCA